MCGEVYLAFPDLTYQEMDGYRTDLHHSMARLEAFAAEPGRAALFQETA